MDVVIGEDSIDGPQLGRLFPFYTKIFHITAKEELFARMHTVKYTLVLRLFAVNIETSYLPRGVLSSKRTAWRCQSVAITLVFKALIRISR